MRARQLLIGLALPLVLTACSFEEPPSTTPPPGGAPINPSGPAVPAATGIDDGCTAVAVTLLDGQLDGLPTASPEEFVKANEVVEQFVARYDAVIVASGVPAARERYTSEIAAACAE